MGENESLGVEPGLNVMQAHPGSALLVGLRTKAPES